MQREDWDWLKKSLGAHRTVGVAPSIYVLPKYLAFDTRRIFHPSETLFFALEGPQRDGHQFLEKAYSLGVRCFVVSNVKPNDFPEAYFFLVEDTTEALQNLVAAHRKRFDFPIVGITGSNGKTIVKEWLFQLLEKNYNIVRSPGSFNSQIGVPLSVWQMEKKHQLALFEAGISTVGEMEKLAEIIQPSIGIFTSIGSAHDAGFASEKEKVAEKMKLFKSASVLIYPKGQTAIHEAAELWKKEKKGRTCLAWTTAIDANAALSEVGISASKSKSYTSILAKNPKGESLKIKIPFTDSASVQNSLSCWLLCQHLGLSLSTIAKRMAQMQPIEMRLEIMAGIHGCTLLNDSYNNDLNSLAVTLEQAAKHNKQPGLTLILSDILQNSDPNLYAQVAVLLQRFGIENIIGIGSKIVELKKHLPKSIERHFFQTTDHFLAELTALEFQNQMIVLKGARPFAFERIAKRLEQKAHRTILEVNLSALLHNLNVYRRCLKPKTKLMVMVKASGYGSGSEQVARLLEYHGADYLGVAFADEGVYLRQQGIRLPIMVLNTDAASFEALLQHQLEPEVYSLPHLYELADFCKKHKSTLKIHLKMETGMNRLGFDEEDLAALKTFLKTNTQWLQVASVFSHLSGSDSSDFDGFTQQQAKRFEAMFEVLSPVLPAKTLRHLVNTGGIVRQPNLHYDMVRLGIGLYGVEAGTTPEPLRTVMALKASISQIRDVQEGETVGYNRSGKISGKKRIATVSIGYADGLLRLAGNGRFSLWIYGKMAPIVGNVCMDMCMLDISDIPNAQIGDMVEVFGENQPVEMLAKTLQTIPYEVFTNISERVKRIYVED